MKPISLSLVLFTLLLSSCQSHSPRSSLPKVSVQLWSVRTPLTEDFDNTIAQLAKLGFQGVELAGYFGPYKDDPSGFLALLAKHKLVISSAHVSTTDLSTQNINATIEKYRRLGVDTLILPSDKRSDDAENITRFIDELNRIHGQLTDAGMRFGFHNHDREFTQYKQHTFWDEIAQNTDPAFILQLDIGWVNRAGLQPSEMIKKYSGRMQLAHFKAKLNAPSSDKRPIIGEDDLNWNSILRDSIRYGGIEWLVVEQEEYPDNLTPLASLALSKRGVDNAIAAIRQNGHHSRD